MGQILHLIRDLLWILCGIRDQTFGVRDQIFGYKKWDIIDGIIYKIYKTVYLQNYTIYKTGSRAVLLSSAKQYMYLLFSLKRCIIKQLLDFCDVSFYNNCSTGNSLNLYFTLVLPLSRLFLVIVM